jgi:hypothetical protein
MSGHASRADRTLVVYWVLLLGTRASRDALRNTPLFLEIICCLALILGESI